MFLLHAIMAPSLMAAACWASNMWPGRSLLMGCVTRITWWALPLSIIMLWMNKASVDQTLFMGIGAWCGAWTPHTPPPSIRLLMPVLLADLTLSLFRSLVVLLPIGVMLYMCGMFWFEMVKAACLTITCIGLGCVIPSRIRGLEQGEQITGVLFGAVVGFFLVAAGAIPSYQPEMIP